MTLGIAMSTFLVGIYSAMYPFLDGADDSFGIFFFGIVSIVMVKWVSISEELSNRDVTYA